MFDVYQHRDDRLEWLGRSETELRSRLLAIMVSKKNHSRVLVVETMADGTTIPRYTFESGERAPTPTIPLPFQKAPHTDRDRP